MIQIYSRDNTNYSNNGDVILFPEECILRAQLNGTWKISMVHPIDDEGRWKSIEPETVLAVPTFMGDKQLFRVSDKIEKNDYEISISAYPIFWDAADEHMLVDIRPTAKNGQDALDIMTNGTKYSGKSNISTGNTAYFVRRNLLDAINGEKEPTFVKIWGGEILYNNYEVIINERVGGDYGYEVRYGKNMESVRHTIDMSEVITRIFPVAYNGYTLSSNYVDSPLLSKYAKVYAREMVFSDVKMRVDANEDDEENGIIVCDTQEQLDTVLISKCSEQYAAGVDRMKITIAVNMIDLAYTEDYKDFKDLEKVSLGDSVRCYNYRLDIATEQRVIELEWDCVNNKAKSFVIGDYEETFIDETISIINRVENVITKDGNVMAERIQGIIDGINTQLRLQSTVAKKQDVRAILFEDLDPNSPVYGAMALGTQGLQISNKRTIDERDWEWTTAFTAKGGYANAIIAGILSDKTGSNYWNLDTGLFAFKGDKITIDSTKWKVKEDGSQECSDIKATGGEIAGWDIKDDRFEKTVIDPNNTNIVYRVLFRTPIKTALDSTVILALYKSVDGGNTWDQTFNFISSGAAKIGNVSVSSDGAVRVYDKEDRSNFSELSYNKIRFYENNNSKVGLYKSSDGNYYLQGVTVLNA